MSQPWKVQIETLSPRVARIGYTADGNPPGPTFGVRHPRPTPVPLPADGVVRLFDGAVTVTVKPDSRPPEPGNLRIDWTSGGRARTWAPGDLDDENLGASFLSLDNLWRDYIPAGVRPADPLTPFNQQVRDCATLTRAIEAAWDQRNGRYPTTEQRNGEVRRVLAGQDPALFDAWPETVLQARELVRHSPPGLLTRSGLSLFRDDTPPWDPQAEWIRPRRDPAPVVLYLVFHDCDWKLACRELTALLGPPPRLPPWLLGVWYSNYSELGAADLERIVAQFAEHDLPLDVISVDMDWHGKEWCGWQWNRPLFPDPEGFGRTLRERGLHATFNVHPLYLPPGEPRIEEFIRASGHDGARLGPGGDWHVIQKDHLKVDIRDRAQADAYMRIFHEPIERAACDFWWVDGWERHPDGREDTSLLNHVYRTRQTQLPPEQSVVLSRAGGLGAHRDVVLFTGDACSQWEVLAFEVETSIRASGALLPYVSHDIGGFFHDPQDWPTNQPPDDLFLRWLQFGCLSSTMRLHSFDGVREPWRFGPGVLATARRFMHLRLRLAPWLDRLVEQAHATGVPLVRPMWFEFPDADAYECLGQYMLGEALLVAPVTRPDSTVRCWLPPGRWHHAFSERVESGGRWIEERVAIEVAPLWLRDGFAVELGEPRPRVEDVLAGPRHEQRAGNWA